MSCTGSHGWQELLRHRQRSPPRCPATDYRHRFPAYQRLVFRNKLYELREERDMKPETFPILVSALLYEKRFGPYFCQPVIAGLGDDD
ncbi:hypothetical protein Q3G72_006181 [Acer saccharum]|nr:hypothetical protein Q3G72_006181 [Acer saccharum]